MMPSALRRIAALGLVLVLSTATLSAEPTVDGKEADRTAPPLSKENLQVFVLGFTDAISERKFDDRIALDDSSRIVTPDLEVHVGKAAFIDYLRGLFEGKKPLLVSLGLKPQIEGEPVPLGPDRVWIQGSTSDTLLLQTGEYHHYPGRFTALVRDTGDGTLLIEALQIAAHPLENSFLERQDDLNFYAAIGGLVMGLAFGLWICGRGRSEATAGTLPAAD